jgi:hypothetical protein
VKPSLISKKVATGRPSWRSANFRPARWPCDLDRHSARHRQVSEAARKVHHHRKVVDGRELLLNRLAQDLHDRWTRRRCRQVGVARLTLDRTEETAGEDGAREIPDRSSRSATFGPRRFHWSEPLEYSFEFVEIVGLCRAAENQKQELEHHGYKWPCRSSSSSPFESLGSTQLFVEADFFDDPNEFLNPFRLRPGTGCFRADLLSARDSSNREASPTMIILYGGLFEPPHT